MGPQRTHVLRPGSFTTSVDSAVPSTTTAPHTSIHAPTLGATAGVWSITLATIVYFSMQGFSLFLHAALIALFVALTTPVTTIFLMRAALFRERQKGGAVPMAEKPEKPEK